MTGDPVVVVPGDLDVEDRIAGPVTFRMAAWLAAAAGGVALVVASRGAVAPTSLGVVLVAVGVVGAWWRPGGRPVAAWAGPLLAYRKRHRSYREPTVVAEEPSPDPAPAEAPAGGSGSRRAVRFAGVVVAVATVAAAAGVLASRGVREPEPAGVVVPVPSLPPVVVVVPVDPFGGWEVGGDVVDPFCGC